MASIDILLPERQQLQQSQRFPRWSYRNDLYDIRLRRLIGFPCRLS